MRALSGLSLPSSSSMRFAFVLALLFSFACGSPPAEKAPTAVKVDAAVVATEPVAPAAVMIEEGKIPVGASDPSRGNPAAPLTLVVFSDFQCPFCMKHAQTVAALERRLGPDTLRVVYKHFPLDFHTDARGVGALGASVHLLGGDAAFWAFHDTIFAPGADLRDLQELAARAVGEAARVAPITAREVVRMAEGRGGDKVESDLALGERLGVRGTPASFLNGIFISGAQPFEELARIADEELVAARAELLRGTSPGSLYARRVDANLARPEPPRVPVADRDPPSRPAPDATVWAVPVGGSPTRGSADAPVTIVTFTDLQCPFCAKLAATLSELDRRYQGRLRFVYKHRPLAFHKQARPAAELLARIYATKSSTAFWAAHDAIFTDWSSSSVDDAALDALATKAGVPVRAAVPARELEKHARAVALDEQLAEDVEVNGTPQSFVNGRRVSGAQPVEAFAAIVDEELAKAEALVRSGVGRRDLYEHVVGSGKRAFPPRKLSLPPADAHTPRRGLAGAPVVLTVFTDFQCPYCKRHAETVAAIEKEFRGSVRVELRNNALPFHPNAHAAASLALEARKQQGDAAFWKLHDAMFADQRGLDRAGLLDKAREAGLDVAKAEAALDANAYTREIDTDMALARSLGLEGTPVTLVNGYVVEGAVDIDKLRRVVRHALDEARPSKKR